MKYWLYCNIESFWTISSHKFIVQSNGLSVSTVTTASPFHVLDVLTSSAKLDAWWSETDKYRKMKQRSTEKWNRDLCKSNWNRIVQRKETVKYEDVKYREMKQRSTEKWNRAVQVNETEKYEDMKQWSTGKWNREV